MPKTCLNPESKRWCLYLVFTLLSLIFSENTQAQKNDYMVFGDTAQSDGYIKNLPTENSTVVYFKKVKREEYKKYSVADVTELFVNHRRFYTREIQINGSKKTVFLQLVPQELEQVKLWKHSEERDYYFLEDEEGLNLMEESNYREKLKRLLDNGMLDPLIDITSLREYDLIYLFQTAKLIQEPRTFSRVLVIRPFVGYSMFTNQFTGPNSGLSHKVSGKSATLGFNLEVFLNPQRNLSVNFSPSWMAVSTQNFLANSEGLLTFETDLFLEYSVITFPVSGKYYLEIQPNQWRAYLELGYSLGFFDYSKLGYYQAEIIDKSVTTTRGEFELDRIYTGFVGGLGLEKYFKKSKAISLGIRTFNMSGGSGEKFLNNTGFIGFKF